MLNHILQYVPVFFVFLTLIKARLKLTAFLIFFATGADVFALLMYYIIYIFNNQCVGCFSCTLRWLTNAKEDGNWSGKIKSWITSDTEPRKKPWSWWGGISTRLFLQRGFYWRSEEATMACRASYSSEFAAVLLTSNIDYVCWSSWRACSF